MELKFVEKDILLCILNTEMIKATKEHAKNVRELYKCSDYDFKNIDDSAIAKVGLSERRIHILQNLILKIEEEKPKR